MTYKFNPSILRAYDIRGAYNENLNDEDAYHLARSFATFLSQRNIAGKVVAAWDGRLSSPSLYESLEKGFVESGIDVVVIGLMPTPALYYASYTTDCAGGIMITGSHNPGHHNGFKMVLQKRSFFGDEIQELGRIAEVGEYVNGAGTISEKDISNEYLNSLISKAISPNGKRLKIAWDPGNGATGKVVEELSKRIDAEHFLINTKIDGTFPAHHPDPTLPENMEQLITLVKKEGCDLGVAFDGDGDRVGAVDNEGRIIYGDQLLLIFAEDLLKRVKGAKIIADVKTSDLVFKRIKDLGGEPIMWKTGHSLIKSKMKEEGALLAGEMSGHTFFAEDYYGFDDALYGACKLINILAHGQEKLSQMVDRMPSAVSTPELRLDVEEERKFAIVEELKEVARKAGDELNDIDGVRVKVDKGWWLIRASNTQSCLVMRVEGNTQEDMQAILDHVKGYFRKIGFMPKEIA
jgi:phosphomannomutase